MELKALEGHLPVRLRRDRNETPFGTETSNEAKKKVAFHLWAFVGELVENKEAGDRILVPKRAGIEAAAVETKTRKKERDAEKIWGKEGGIGTIW